MGEAAIRAGPTANWTIRPITGVFGAEIAGFGIASASPDEAIVVRELLREHKVLVFPGQELTGPRELAAFGRLFGELDIEPHHMHQPVEGDPAVKALVFDAAEAVQPHQALQDPWHSDSSTRESTRFLSILQAVDVPDYGRDTVFADMEAAFDHLSAPMQRFLEGLTAIHSWSGRKPGAPDREHPVILTDPVNGRKALFVNPTYTVAIKELNPVESRAILDALFQQGRYPQIQLRVSWRNGQIVMWDNERVQHGIIFDRHYRRVMHRVMVTERPREAA